MIQASLLEKPGLRHAFFTRQGGVSQGLYASLNCGPGSDDDPDHVAQNRVLAAEQMRVTKDNLCTLYQVHGKDVVFVTKPWPDNIRPQADAMVTQTPGLALGILTADCAPVLLADPIAGCIGAAHAGWQGAINGVIDSTVRAMEELGARATAIQAAIGPTIQQDSYEVGSDFHTRVTAQDPTHEQFFIPGARPDHFQFDLSGFVEAALRRAGVRDIEKMNRDTYREEEAFFSYRRTTHRREADYGRQLSAIALVRPHGT